MESQEVQKYTSPPQDNIIYWLSECFFFNLNFSCEFARVKCIYMFFSQDAVQDALSVTLYMLQMIENFRTYLQDKTFFLQVVKALKVW